MREVRLHGHLHEPQLKEEVFTHPSPGPAEAGHCEVQVRVPHPLQRGQGSLRPGFLVRGVESGRTLPPSRVSTTTPTKIPPPSPPSLAKAPPPPSFLDLEQRNEPRRRAKSGWASTQPRKKKPDAPPVAPAVQQEPPTQESGKLQREPANIHPLLAGFEKGRFLLCNFPGFSRFMRHTSIFTAATCPA